MSAGQAVAQRRPAAADPALAGSPLAKAKHAPPLPLVIDLDREALPAGLTAELVICAMQSGLGPVLALLRGARQGRAAIERSLSGIPQLDLTSLAAPASMRTAAQRARDEGREVILLTAAHPQLAARLWAHGWADGVLQAGEGDDLAELGRLAAVRARCPSGFVVFSTEREPPLWARAGSPYELPEPAEADRPSGSQIRLWAKALRLHQWAKNLLVFLPLVLAGRAGDPGSWLAAAAAFFAFGLVASATYLVNDLHDLAHDRAHRSKRYRPLASGALPIPQALAAAGLGLGGGATLAVAAGWPALAVLGAYLAVTLAYTFALKRVVILDTVTLAALFTLRLVGGIVFCQVAGSAWLLTLSMFLFTSLALAKRFVEIEQLADGAAGAIAGRGYIGRDAPTVLAFGAATSAAAVLIFSLYIVEAAARQPFYCTPDLLWFAPTMLFVWLGRIWILCGRSELHDDPVEFAIRDRASHLLGFAIFLSFVLACIRF